MSNYTTGELAKISHISVRTLQYYDKKELLTPSSKTDSGGRIYNATDMKKLKLILLLKSLGLKLSEIKQITEAPNAIKTLSLILTEQEKAVKAELKDSQKQLKMIESVKNNLTDIDHLTLNSIDDINKIMNNKKALRRVHINLLLIGTPFNILELVTLVYGIVKGNWLPFIIAMILVAIEAVLLTRYYFKNTNYICPNCNTTFKPAMWTAFWAKHTPKTRRLTCPNCGQTNNCVEVYDDGSLDQKS
ncbi:MerR family transcriptional regulator [Companilactobacillus furfuricola]|uniref:MerR family transcriptional regulator n=1 Tax=Companilactobacillus furfuricola TaxID=1462575 RepID=UPI000F79DB0B|nr:MerR family transcriptional regulator [Companilactobacillus furfuricola]